MIIRTATPADAKDLLSIYAPYVEETAITFEYEVPSVEAFRSRIKKTLERYPYIVAVDAKSYKKCNSEESGTTGTILGYAYASAFKGRAAYDWSVETTVYVRRDRKRGGVGKALYMELERLLKKQGILNLNACISIPKEGTTYLTADSYEFHKHLGYELVGTFHDSGYKFQEWYDMIWMEKMIGAHEKEQKPIKSFSEVRHEETKDK